MNPQKQQCFPIPSCGKRQDSVCGSPFQHRAKNTIQQPKTNKGKQLPEQECSSLSIFQVPASSNEGDYFIVIVFAHASTQPYKGIVQNLVKTTIIHTFKVEEFGPTRRCLLLTNRSCKNKIFRQLCEKIQMQQCNILSSIKVKNKFSKLYRKIKIKKPKAVSLVYVGNNFQT